jgi:hypothetical protein
MDEEKDQAEENDSDTVQPLSIRELVMVILSGHLGVRKREQRVNDFDRANGLHVFLAAAFYFALIVTGLIVLVSYIAS